MDGKHVKFSFSTLVADKLAAHLVGSFQPNLNDGHFCRRCFMTYDKKALPIDSVVVNARIINVHDNLVQQFGTNALS